MTNNCLVNVIKSVLNELSPYIKVADWNKKERIRAKIKTIVKKSLMKMAGSKISYKQIDTIANEMLAHMEVIFVAA